MSAAVQQALSWFEIPTTNLDRATRFYETVLATTLRREAFGGTPIAIFNYEEPSTGGCLIESDRHQPSAHGVIVYLTASPSVDAALARVERAGGKVLGPSIELPNDIGFIGFITDTEGNRIGLHSRTNG